MDRVQEVIELHDAQALATHRRHMAAQRNGAAPGICIDCGEAIAPERLAASPDAARCIHCQAVAERHP